ncbi:MAG: NUDIX hydrolase [Chloroflexota bacterium]
MAKPVQGGQVVIFNDAKSQVLLIKREDFRIWVPPGGRLEEGETPEEAAIREAWEETGYQVAVEYYVGEYRRPQFGNGITHVFVGHVVGGDGRDRSWESLAVEWFDVDKLPKRTFSLAKEIILDAQSANDLPLKRDQYLPIWLVGLLFIGLRIRNVRNWVMGR